MRPCECVWLELEVNNTLENERLWKAVARVEAGGGEEEEERAVARSRLHRQPAPKGCSRPITCFSPRCHGTSGQGQRPDT